MSKARKSTIGTATPDNRGSLQINTLMSAAPKAKPAVAAAQIQPVTPAAPRSEARPKTTKRMHASKKRSNAVTVATTIERTVFTREEAAAIIGTSPVTLWREAKAGKLGHTLIGKRIRFLREDLDRYTRGESPRPGALVGWAKDEERAERMRQVHAAKKARG